MGPLLLVAVFALAGTALAYTVGRRSALAAGEAAEQRAAEREQEVDRLRAELVVTVGHELRTPLTVIQGLVTLLSRHWTTLAEPKKLDLIDDLAFNVSSLDSSILHFIDAARIERGEVTLSCTEVELAPVVEEMRTKLASVIAGYDLQVKLEAPTAWCDRESVGRILELLVANATRFSPLASRIVVRSRAHTDATVLTVTDQGQGIAAGHLAHVFEPFWRADVAETGVSRGAGLGLSIVRSLAEMHGGEVSVRSVKGRGSTFEVRLPRHVDEVLDEISDRVVQRPDVRIGQEARPAS
ncbi:MAG: HAMP domain-containing histidine kinase [Actinobacteria bacterium]|nr:HAMP domain-containing histidine kinase [Actinomycetota bacterium]MBV8957529.1 HAMP domain-containing histidine kinase [Actinomycetota bacterium]MBV9252784.1 HAMP domain-containing histidine kinase [Actinomycetota bacterium]